MQLEKLLSQYQKHQILRPKTESHYQGVVSLLIKFMQRDPHLADITVDVLLDFRRHVLSKCSAVTFNNYRRHLSALFNFAVRQHYMTVNPFADVKAAPVPRRKPKTVPIGLLQEIIDFLAKSGDKYDEGHVEREILSPRWFWLIVIKTFYYSAIRRRQLVELRLKDINFDDRLIRLRSEGSKTLREWDIPLPDPLVDELKFLRARVIDKLGRYDEDQQLFCYPLISNNPERFKAKEMTVDHVTNGFKRLTRLMEQRVSAHRIRHTTATELSKKTENIRLVQELLGHTDLRTTFIYVEPEIGEMRNLMGGMRELVSEL